MIRSNSSTVKAILPRSRLDFFVLEIIYPGQVPLLWRVRTLVSKSVENANQFIRRDVSAMMLDFVAVNGLGQLATFLRKVIVRIAELPTLAAFAGARLLTSVDEWNIRDSRRWSNWCCQAHCAFVPSQGLD